MADLIAQIMKMVTQKFGVECKEDEMFYPSNPIIDRLIGVAVGLVAGAIICMILNILHDKPWR